MLARPTSQSFSCYIIDTSFQIFWNLLSNDVKEISDDVSNLIENFWFVRSNNFQKYKNNALHQEMPP